MPSVAYLQGHYKKINDILTNVGLEVNIGTPPGGSAIASTDPLWQQLTQLAKRTGQDFIRIYDWQMMQRRFVLTTTAGTPPAPGQPPQLQFYALPADFLRLLPQTTWDYTTRLPMIGPLSPQMRTWLVGRVANQFNIFLGFDFENGDIGLFPGPNVAGQVCFFEYMSKSWCQPFNTADQDGRYDPEMVNFTDGSDLVLFDPHLFSRALKLRWLAEKGLDTSAAETDFETAWGAVVGPDAGAPKLNMNSTSSGFRYLDAWANVPPTGFGTT